MIVSSHASCNSMTNLYTWDLARFCAAYGVIE